MMVATARYRYRVDGAGAVDSLTNGVQQYSGHVFIDGVRTNTWLGPLSSCERDLLRVFSAVLDVDRLSPRQPMNDPKLMQDVAWQRQIDVEIAVEDPTRWNALSTPVATLLHFMTDDAWNLNFVGVRAPALQQQLAGTNEPCDADEVALFSGGLDSVLGLYARSLQSKGRFVAVSACGNDVRGHAQSDAIGALREEGVNVQWLKFVHQL